MTVEAILPQCKNVVDPQVSPDAVGFLSSGGLPTAINNRR